MRTFEEALYDIYDRAKERQIIERRRKKRLMTIAATCATLSVVVVLSAVYVWRPWNDGKTPDDRVVLEGTNGDKKWISDIPGAVYIENPEYFDGENRKYAALSREGVAAHLKHSLVVIGDVENIKSFYIIDDELYIWYITTFDIKISMEVNGEFETDTLKCVTSFRRLYNGSSASKCGLCDVGKEIVDNPTGAFVVKDVLDDSWHWHNVYYNVSDYADYYVTWRYNYSSKGVLDPYGKPITFDEIKNDSVL